MGDGKVIEQYPDPAEQRRLIAQGRNAMPAFSGSLSSAESDAVVRYARGVVTALVDGTARPPAHGDIHTSSVEVSMLATISSSTLSGVDGHPVSVEVHVADGLPGFSIVAASQATTVDVLAAVGELAGRGLIVDDGGKVRRA